MFDQALLQLPSYESKRAAITTALAKAHEAGTLTYTDLLLAPREVYTIAFEVMDGVSKSGDNIPVYQPQEREFDFGPVRLMSIDTEPHHRIKTWKWKQSVIPGTSMVSPRKVEVITDHGWEFATEDRYEDGRPARRLLIDFGWPIRQVTSRSGTLGHIVEMKWLERVVNGPDATEEFTTLYAALKARIEQSRPDKKSPPAGNDGRQKEIRP
jgi:hypothetical protein